MEDGEQSLSHGCPRGTVKSTLVRSWAPLTRVQLHTWTVQSDSLSRTFLSCVLPRGRRVPRHLTPIEPIPCIRRPQQEIRLGQQTQAWRHQRVCRRRRTRRRRRGSRSRRRQPHGHRAAAEARKCRRRRDVLLLRAGGCMTRGGCGGRCGGPRGAVGGLYGRAGALCCTWGSFVVRGELSSVRT